MMSLQEASDLYEQAQNLKNRYDDAISLDKSSSAGYQIDETNYTVRDKQGAIIGLIRGNVFDRDQILQDLIKLSSINSRLAELEVDINEKYASQSQKIKKLKAKLYCDYTNTVYKKDDTTYLADVPRTKVNKDHIEYLVEQDSAYTEEETRLLAIERNMKRIKAAIKSSGDFENALKYALNYGDKAM